MLRTTGFTFTWGLLNVGLNVNRVGGCGDAQFDSGVRFFNVAFFCLAKTSALLPRGVVGDVEVDEEEESESDELGDVSVKFGTTGCWAELLEVVSDGCTVAVDVGGVFSVLWEDGRSRTRSGAAAEVVEGACVGFVTRDSHA